MSSKKERIMDDTKKGNVERNIRNGQNVGLGDGGG